MRVIPWWKLIGFSDAIPKHGFIVWLTVKCQVEAVNENETSAVGINR